MDEKISLVEIELARIDWSKLRDVKSSYGEKVVSADYVPSVMKALLNAENLEEAKELEWRIENHILVQRQLFEAAEYLVPILIVSLLEVPQGIIRNIFLSLLFEIVSGFPSQAEINLGNYELAERCRTKAREGLWVLYKLFIDGNEAQKAFSYDVLEQIETDSFRLEAFVNKLKFNPEI